MKLQFYLVIILISLSSCGQAQTRKGVPGNNIIEFVQDKNDTMYYTDPIDDTINFKREFENIYKDNEGKAYLRNVCFRPVSKDTFLYTEYFKDITEFLDLKTYKPLMKGYFQNKGKVYMWWANSDGEYQVEVTGANPKSFIPFDSVAGGKDNKFVFYGGPPGDFEIIKGANPKTIRVLNPERGCWNCGDCYFADDKSVYYGLTKIEGADPVTFQLVNKDNLDAVDKKGNYFEGRLIKLKYIRK